MVWVDDWRIYIGFYKFKKTEEHFFFKKQRSRLYAQLKTSIHPPHPPHPPPLKSHRRLLKRLHV